MGRLNQFKNTLAWGEKNFLAEYEAPMNQLFDELDAKGLLNKSFDRSKVERIKKFAETSIAAQHLSDNVHKLYSLKNNERSQILPELGAKGFKVDNIGAQSLAMICHAYQVNAEKLKLYLVTLIDVSKLNLKKAHKTELGRLIGTLKDKFPNNKFVNVLDTAIRNAVTHYSYYFENEKLYLCNGYFDQDPKVLNLSEFMIETQNLHILAESFFAIYLDKYRPNRYLILEK